MPMPAGPMKRKRGKRAGSQVLRPAPLHTLLRRRRPRWYARARTVTTGENRETSSRTPPTRESCAYTFTFLQNAPAALRAAGVVRYARTAGITRCRADAGIAARTYLLWSAERNRIPAPGYPDPAPDSARTSDRNDTPASTRIPALRNNLHSVLRSSATACLRCRNGRWRESASCPRRGKRFGVG